MSSWLLFLLLCPFLVLAIVLGAVAIVALLQARPEDVPAVFAAGFGSAFGRLTGLLPRRPDRMPGPHPPLTTGLAVLHSERRLGEPTR